MNGTKWNKRFWADLGERVAATFVGALLTLIVMDNVLEGPDWDTTLWPVVVLPTLISLLKGLAANLGNGETGASLLPTAPPGPEVNPDADHYRNELGALSGFAVFVIVALSALVLFLVILPLARG